MNVDFLSIFIYADRSKTAVNGGAAMPQFSFDKSFLSERETEKLEAMEGEIAQLHANMVDLVREAARRQRICAPDLEGLKPFLGERFVKMTESQRPYGFQGAFVVGRSEVAYLCRGIDGYGCGWVKGEPIGKKYSDFGVLSGSAGTQYHCRICGQEIGRVVTARS